MNNRFSDYVTSGAFTLTLTRNQIASLGLAHAGHGYLPNAQSLERKGLVECVPKPEVFNEDQVEFRPTRAGLLCMAMITEAGLGNGPPDPVAEEFDAMRSELVARREEARQARLVAQAAQARRDEVEAELENARREIIELRTGQRQRLMLPIVRVRDPLPEVSDADLAAMINEGAPA